MLTASGIVGVILLGYLLYGLDQAGETWMNSHGGLQILVLFAVVLLLVKPLGA